MLVFPRKKVSDKTHLNSPKLKKVRVHQEMHLYSLCYCICVCFLDCPCVCSKSKPADSMLKNEADSMLKYEASFSSIKFASFLSYSSSLFCLHSLSPSHTLSLFPPLPEVLISLFSPRAPALSLCLHLFLCLSLFPRSRS